MRAMIRFHLDQHISNFVARGLMLRAIDVSTTAEAGLQDADDVELLAFALSENRVIVTQDADFLRKHDAGNEHAGIIFNQHGTRTVGELIRFLELVNDCLEPEDMAGKVEFF
jgi:predicted nuclease of predicted toxin-antitoxin system